MSFNTNYNPLFPSGQFETYLNRDISDLSEGGGAGRAGNQEMENRTRREKKKKWTMIMQK